MRLPLVALAALLAGFLAGCSPSDTDSPSFSEDEVKRISSLSLSQLPALPADPSNAVADDPAAAALGKALFFDTRLSSNGKVSCASCHLPERQFQDDVALAKGVGQTARRTMPIASTAYSPWLFWDGRKDSQWSQALGPLESSVEHGTNRTRIAHQVATNYAVQYEAVFGPLPALADLPEDAAPTADETLSAAWSDLDSAQQDRVNRIFANVGKAIAAFERTITPEPTRFDTYADALAKGKPTEGVMTSQEVAGLKLFVGKANCTNCHNGPLLTDNYFHNTGVGEAPGLPQDDGRGPAIAQVLSDPFNCLGRYSDAKPEDCAELKFIAAAGEEMIRAYKPPTLRGVARRSPFMHAGQIGTLAEVLAHYNAAPEAPRGHSELRPLSLSEDELSALEAFLRTLDPLPRNDSGL